MKEKIMTKEEIEKELESVQNRINHSTSWKNKNDLMKYRKKLLRRLKKK